MYDLGILRHVLGQGENFGIFSLHMRSKATGHKTSPRQVLSTSCLFLGVSSLCLPGLNGGPKDTSTS